VIKLGYKASAEQFGPRELLKFSVLAEELGFDSVFVSDHFQPWTSRVLIGTSVLTPTFRYHPSLVAQAFGTLGAIFPGRVILGVGTGESLNEVPAMGIAWPEFKERFARLREANDLIRRLWREERVTFEGTYYRTVNATVYDRPDVEVPIYVAAAGALVAKYAGRTGDGFITTSGKAPTLYSETLLPNVTAGLQAASRPDTIDKMIEMKVSYDTDMQRAMEDTREWAALALTPEQKMHVEDPIEMQRLAESLSAEQAATRWIVSTDPEQQVERIKPYVDLGFRHLVFHAPGCDQERFLRLYAKDVLPRLRAKFG